MVRPRENADGKLERYESRRIDDACSLFRLSGNSGRASCSRTDRAARAPALCRRRRRRPRRSNQLRGHCPTAWRARLIAQLDMFAGKERIRRDFTRCFHLDRPACRGRGTRNTTASGTRTLGWGASRPSEWHCVGVHRGIYGDLCVFALDRTSFTAGSTCDRRILASACGRVRVWLLPSDKGGAVVQTPCGLQLG
jgi:hypothetical protein